MRKKLRSVDRRCREGHGNMIEYQYVLDAKKIMWECEACGRGERDCVCGGVMVRLGESIDPDKRNWTCEKCGRRESGEGW